MDAALRDLLTLTLAPGLGPVLTARCLELFGTPAAVLAASPAQLERVKGIGKAKSAAIAVALREAATKVDDEIEQMERRGVTLIRRGDTAYSPLLETIPDPPPLLYARGTPDFAGKDRYPLAIVGSRDCTSYGLEQAERFAGVIAGAGLTIISGGARGIDTAAHRGALRVEGRTIAVIGCGLEHPYPPENARLFDDIVARGGAILSELPMRTPPAPDQFPPRNRIVSGLSLGVLVIEAARGSGALITARIAAEDHGREVFVVPGRIDSPASRGSNELIKIGGAALVTEPGDIIHALESPARHQHLGTHADRYAKPTDDSLFGATDPELHAVLAALACPRTPDELARDLGMDPSVIRTQLTLLEIRRLVERRGAAFVQRT